MTNASASSQTAPAPPPAEAAEPALSIQGLRRRYGGAGGYEAVRGVDLDVAAGTITCLLGTNGAGKTSTLEVVEGLAAPTEGSVRVLGLDPVADRAQVRRRTSVLLQESGFSGDLTVRETLVMWHATVTRARPVQEVIDLVDLGERADVAVRALSGGERRRLDLACTLTTRAEVVLLDEPTTGLDPESRRRVWQVLEDLRADGVTVLLCTHYLEEAEALADSIAILHEGRVVRVGTVAEITAEAPSTIRFRLPGPEVEPPTLPGTATTREEQSVTVRTDDVQRDLTVLLGWAEEHGVRLERLEARTASLESVFLDIARVRTDQPADQTADQTTDQTADQTADQTEETR